MTLQEFYRTECKDIIALVRGQKSDYAFKYDVRDVTDEGVAIYCIRDVDGTHIAVDDILYMEERAYVDKYPNPASKAAREQYLSEFTIYEGEDALRTYQLQMAETVKERERLKKEATESRANKIKSGEFLAGGSSNSWLCI